MRIRGGCNCRVGFIVYRGFNAGFAVVGVVIARGLTIIKVRRVAAGGCLLALVGGGGFLAVRFLAVFAFRLEVRIATMTAIAAAPPVAPPAAVFRPVVGIAIGVIFLVLGVLLLGMQQCLAIRDGDLVVIGMDFAEGKETVAVSAIFDKGCLKRRFYARYAG